MKILVATTSYPRHRDDAAGGFVQTRVEQLLAAGHRVEVVAAGDESARDPATEALSISRVSHQVPGMAPLFYGAGAPERFDAQPAGAWLGGLRFFAALTNALRPRLAGADAVESHWLVPSALAVVTLGHQGPHRAHAHSGDVAMLETMPLGAALARRLVTAGITPIFASADLRERFARLLDSDQARAQIRAAAVQPADSRLTLAPALRPARAERQRRRRLRGIAGPVILGVGRLVPIKGYDRLLRAASRLAVAAGQPAPTIVLLGDGPERSTLQDLASRRGLDLRLPGQVSQADVADWLGLAEVFVHPCRALISGRTEGLPVAVREALLAGLPVVAVASGGLAAELAASWPGQLQILSDAPASALPALLAKSITDALEL